MLCPVMAITVTLAASSANAATPNWTSTSSTSWTTGSNWSTGTAPLAADTVVINLGAYGPNIVAAGATATNVQLGTTSGGTGTINITSGGGLSDANSYIGYATGSVGTATVSGTGSLWTNTATMYVGNYGTGNLTIASDAQVNALGVRVGEYAGSKGTVSVTDTGSAWNVGTSGLYLGLNAGTGTLLIANGGVVSDTVGYIGYGTGSIGSATVTGTGTYWNTATGNLNVGNSGTGILTIQNGGSVTDQSGLIANGSGSLGVATVTGSGSNWQSTGSLNIGAGGSGSLAINGGALVSDGTGNLGASTGSFGTAAVTGSGSSWTNSGTLYVGNNGSGSLSVSSGGSVLAGSSGITFGNNAGSVGTATVTGTGSSLSSTGGFTVGNTGSGLLLIENGGTASDAGGLAQIGRLSGSTGSVIVSDTGSSWATTGFLYVANTGSGSLLVENGGAVSDTSSGYLAYNAGSFGTATVTGSGSTWNNGTGGLNVGYRGTGSLTISSGGTVTDTTGQIGSNTGSLGSVTVDGTGSTWANTSYVQVGSSGTGSLVISNGGVVSDTIGYLGTNISSSIGTATVTGSGSAWTNSSTLNIGNNGTGALTVTNGGAVSAANFVIGQSTGGLGSAVVSGSGSMLTDTNNLNIGSRGTGTLTVSDGGQAFSTADYNIGTYAGGSGTATVSSGGILATATRFHMGEYGTGELDVLNGGTAISVGGYLGDATGSAVGNATISGTGSLWSNSGDLNIGYLGTGSMTIAYGGVVTTGSGAAYTNNGVDVLSSATTYIAALAGSTGTLNIGSAPGSAAVAPGTLSAATVAFGAGTGTINFNHTSSDYIFAPAITGSGTINAYAGTTELTGDLSGFTGTTNLLGGDLIYSFASGSGTGSTINAALLGAGTLAIASGGVTYLASDSSGFTGTTTIASGSTLSVNGELGGALDVDAGGTLKGHGTAGDVTTSSGAILAPGNSIGTLTVSSLTVATGTVYQAEVNAAGASDLIHATGTATINGGTVDVIAAPGSYVAGTRYTILTADAGVAGTFDALEGTLSGLFLSTELSYDSNDVYLDVTQAQSFASIAQTRNQVATAGALQALGSGNGVYDAFALQTDAGAARRALDTLSGVSLVSNQAALLNEQHLLSDALLARMDSIADARPVTQPFQLAYQGQYMPGMVPAPTGQAGVWMQGFGDWSQLRGDANAAGIHDQSNGVLVGADTQLSDHWQGGAAFGYSHSYLSSDSDPAHSDSDNYHAALYAQTHIPQGPDIRLGGSYSWHALSNRRAVDFDGYTLEGERADSSARSAQLFADVSQPITLLVSHLHGTNTTLAPFATLAYQHEEGDGFTENGGAAALTVGDSSMDVLSSTLGARLHQAITFAPSSAIARAGLDGSMGWKHTMGDVTPSAAMRFAGGGTSFVIDGDPLARDAFVYGGSISASISPASSLALTYQGQMASGAQEQTLEGRFSYRF